MEKKNILCIITLRLGQARGSSAAATSSNEHKNSLN